ncbi:hypothetical protein ACGFR8_13730 [Streptomyces brevispora]|uniref:hypothetical protein n=1 Tax=Streptomyces brevispora TaxID=887462 RepID=UPI0037165014
MTDLQDFDHAPHVQPGFREAFQTWADFRAHVASAARYPEFDDTRGLQQVLMADLASRVTTGDNHQWLLIGSLALPARVPNDAEWPDDLKVPDTGGLQPAYVVPRSAFDLDLCAHDVTHPDPDRAADLYRSEVMAAIDRVAGPEVYAGDGHGIGLGGLVRYSKGDLRVFPNGQVMGIITAHPIDPRYGPGSLRGVDDPISIEIDVKTPAKVAVTGGPDVSQRPITAFDVPGIKPYQPSLNPIVNQLADKAVLLTGPPSDPRNGTTGAWHRYKDVYDAYFMLKTCRIDADAMREAVEGNWNFKRMNMEAVPRPYRFFGQDAFRSEPEIPWRDGLEAIRSGSPQLRSYPSYETMRDTIGGFMDSLPSAPERSTWVPGRGWALEGAAQAFPRQPAAVIDPDAAAAIRLASKGRKAAQQEAHRYTADTERGTPPPRQPELRERDGGPER